MVVLDVEDFVQVSRSTQRSPNWNRLRRDRRSPFPDLKRFEYNWWVLARAPAPFSRFSRASFVSVRYHKLSCRGITEGKSQWAIAHHNRAETAVPS